MSEWEEARKLKVRVDALMHPKAATVPQWVVNAINAEFGDYTAEEILAIWKQGKE